MLRFTPCQSKQFASLFLFFPSSSSRSLYLFLDLSVPSTWKFYHFVFVARPWPNLSRAYFFYCIFCSFSLILASKLLVLHIWIAFSMWFLMQDFSPFLIFRSFKKVFNSVQLTRLFVSLAIVNQKVSTGVLIRVFCVNVLPRVLARVCCSSVFLAVVGVLARVFAWVSLLGW